jgi:hypothetical protein
MADWSEDYVAVICYLNLNFGLIDDLWLNWRPGEALSWKVEIGGWEGRGVMCGKPTPLRL